MAMILWVTVFAATALDNMAILANMTEVMVLVPYTLVFTPLLNFLPRPRYYIIWPRAEIWMGIQIKEHKILVVEAIGIPL